MNNALQLGFRFRVSGYRMALHPSLMINLRHDATMIVIGVKYVWLDPVMTDYSGMNWKIRPLDYWSDGRSTMTC